MGKAVGNVFQLTVRLLLAILLAYAEAVCSDEIVSSPPTQDYVDIRYDINIPALPAINAFELLVEQTGSEFLFPYDVVEGHMTSAVAGNYSVIEALSTMLQDSGLACGLSKKGAIRFYLSDGSTSQSNGEMTMKKSKKGILAALVAMFSISSVTAAKAQGFDEKKVLEEIIVTATKRSQNIYEVPESMSVLDSERIEREHLLGMADYLNSVPGVTHVSNGVGSNRTVIRGIGATGGDASVGVYFGETLLNLLASGSAVDIKLVDIGQIEVLRGPQGTLYGAGAMGGAVRYAPNEPDLENFEGSVAVDFSSTGERGGTNDGYEAVINIPLVEDKLALRLAGYRYKTEGWVENVSADNPRLQAIVGAFGGEFGPQESGSTTFEGGRATLKWQASDNVSVNLMHLQQDLEQLGSIGTNEESEAIGGAYTTSHLGSTLSGGHLLQLEEVEITSLGVTWDLGWGSVVATTSWIDMSREGYGDLSTVPSIPFPLWQYGPTSADSESQEIRFSSRFKGPFQILAGVYLSNEESVWDTFAEWAGTPGFDTLLFGTSTKEELFTAHVESHIAQKALFGELSYDVTEKLTLTVGGRYFEYDRQRVQDSTGLFAGKDAEPGGDSFSVQDASESGSSFKVNLSYQLNDETNLYAKWSEGFRLGSPVSPLPTSICDLDNDGVLDGTNVPSKVDDLKSDTLESFELGAKSLLLGNRLSLMAAVHQTDWEGIPVTVIGDCGFASRLNAGKSEVKGVEIEAALNVTDSLRIDVNAGYVDAELSEDHPSLGNAGERMPYSSKFNWGVAVQYDFLISDYESYVRANYSYVDDFYPMLDEQGHKGGDYGKLDLSMGAAVGDVNIGLYVTNLLNEDEFANVTPSTAATLYFTDYVRMRPRTVGLSVGYQF